MSNKLKPRCGSVPTCSDFLDRAVRHLFPAHREWPQGTELTTGDEIQTVVKRICVWKAPGSDRISDLAIKTAALNASDIWRTTFNACLREGIFQSHWKVQRLVLHLKGEKPPDKSSSYRSLCMLDITGKLLAVGRCLLASQDGWDAVSLATTIIERLTSTRRKQEKRGASNSRSR